MNLRSNIFITVLLLITVFVACKKNSPNGPVGPTGSTGNTGTTGTTATQEQLIADSVFLFSKEIYYWQDKIGSVTYEAFNPRQYVVTGDPLKTAQAVITKIRDYNDEDKSHGFSYAEEYQSGEVNTSNTQLAVYYENDYGLSIKTGWKNRKITNSNVANDPNFAGWYISYCFPSSPAGLAGIKRGMKLLKIEGVDMGYTNAAIGKINDLLLQNIKTASVELLRNVGDTLRTSINVAKYIPDSFFKSDTIMSDGGRKVGYFMYKFFDDKENSQTKMNAVFSKFKSQNIQDIILDLRYNNGGYATTQDMLANYLAPLLANNQVMYQFFYNSNLQNGNYTVLKSRFPDYRTFALNYNSVWFGSSESINLPKIYIIVSSRSASASELLINNLRASGIMGNNVILIGDANTYGKSVGFFPIDLFKKVRFWTVSSSTKNNSQQSVSFSGFTPDYLVYDGVDKSLGDPTEDCIKAALTLIDGGSLSAYKNNGTVIRAAANSLSSKIKNAPSKFDNLIFSK